MVVKDSPASLFTPTIPTVGIVGKQLFFAAIRDLRNKSDFFTHYAGGLKQTK
jgi:hypothetical protein